MDPPAPIDGIRAPITVTPLGSVTAVTSPHFAPGATLTMALSEVRLTSFNHCRSTRIPSPMLEEPGFGE